MSYNAERHITSVFSDYLSESRERLIEAAQEAEEGVLTRLHAPAQAPSHGDQDQGQGLAQAAPGPDDDDYQGPVTRSRRRTFSDPLCTARSVSGPVDVFLCLTFMLTAHPWRGMLVRRRKPDEKKSKSIMASRH